MTPLQRTLFNFFRSFLYTGHDVTCSVCTRSFRRFIPGGNDRRPNARCPACDALERHRLFALFLNSMADLHTKKSSLLHFAPELCFSNAFKNNPAIEYISADLNSPLAAVHTDITNLVFSDRRFDFIICLHVLEHVSDDAKALTEMFRVLKQGGTALIMTPVDETLDKTIEDTPENTPERRKKLFGAEDHLRRYGKDFTKRIGLSGFIVDSIDYFAEVDPADRKKYGLLPEEYIYRCTKPS